VEHVARHDAHRIRLGQPAIGEPGPLEVPEIALDLNAKVPDAPGLVFFYDLLLECCREPIGEAARSLGGSDRVEGDAIGGGDRATD
jgi:hypothetical protein